MASSACQQTSRPRSQRNQWGVLLQTPAGRLQCHSRFSPWGVPAHQVQTQASNLHKAADAHPPIARTQPEPHMTLVGFRPLPTSWWTSNSKAPDG